MSMSLYQKYRPQTFADVVGQEHVKQALRNQVMRNATSHAYLFTGPRGVGKTTLARILARAVNCEKPVEGEPCNTCKTCQLVLDGTTLDVVEIDAASHTGVDNVREHIISASRVPPVGLKRKVFVIDEVHMLSSSAFNALLKTLEEPPEHAMFILATTESHKVPMTIISRCQRYDFKRISTPDMVKRLQKLAAEEGVEVDEAVLVRVAAKAEGALRDAETLLGQLMVLDEKHITEEIAELMLPRSQAELLLAMSEHVLARKSADAIRIIDQLVEEGVSITDFVRDEIDFLRRAMLFKIDPQLSRLEYIDLSAEQMTRLETAVRAVVTTDLVRVLNLFVTRFPIIKSAELPQIPLELTVLLWTEGDTAGSGQATAQQPATRTPQAPARPPAPANPTRPAPATSFVQKEVRDVPGVTQTAVGTPLIEEAVRGDWGTVMSKLRETNHSLALTVGVSELIGVEDRMVKLGVKYKFHRDRIKTAKNEDVLRGIFEGLWGRPVMLNIEVGDQFVAARASDVVEPSAEEVKNVWDLALNVFGEENKPNAG